MYKGSNHTGHVLEHFINGINSQHCAHLLSHALLPLHNHDASLVSNKAVNA